MFYLCITLLLLLMSSAESDTMGISQLMAFLGVETTAVKERTFTFFQVIPNKEIPCIILTFTGNEYECGAIRPDVCITAYSSIYKSYLVHKSSRLE